MLSKILESGDNVPVTELRRFDSCRISSGRSDLLALQYLQASINAVVYIQLNDVRPRDRCGSIRKYCRVSEVGFLFEKIVYYKRDLRYHNMHSR